MSLKKYTYTHFRIDGLGEQNRESEKMMTEGNVWQKVCVMTECGISICRGKTTITKIQE